MTLTESVAHLASLAVTTDWGTPQERQRARGLALRLAALGWRLDAGRGRVACRPRAPGAPRRRHGGAPGRR